MIYLLIVVYLLWLIYVFDYRKQSAGKNFWFRVTCIIFILLSGLRYRIGGDTIGYMAIYDEFPTLFTVNWNTFSTRFQPLWNLCVLICKTITSDFALLQFIHAIILNISLFSFIRSRCSNLFTCVFLYFILFYSLLNFEVLREALALAIFLIGFQYWEKKKWLPYFVFAIIAYGFHVSAVFLFILPFFRYLKLNFKTATIFILIFIFLSATFFNFFMQFFNFFDVANNTALHEYINNYGMSIQNKSYNLIFRLFLIGRYVLIPLFLLLLPKYCRVKCPIQYSGLVFLFIYISCFSILSNIFQRFLNYIFIFSLFYWSDLILVLMHKYRKSSLIIFLAIVSLFLSLDIYMTVKNGAYKKYYPYHTIFTKEKDIEREKMLVW